MNNCTIRGFWIVLAVTDKGRASLTNCKVDLATSHTYPPEDNAVPVVGIWCLVTHCSPHLKAFPVGLPEVMAL
jgi:hypothetical protein